MKNKNIFLVVGILASTVFIGYLGESEPHSLFGLSVNVWVIRVAWLLISVSNFAKYFKIRKLEREDE